VAQTLAHPRIEVLSNDEDTLSEPIPHYLVSESASGNSADQG
jgi:hypothetical protein